jgi:Ulp1 family protease
MSVFKKTELKEWQSENVESKEYHHSRMKCLFQLSQEEEKKVKDRLSACTRANSDENVSPCDFINFQCIEKNFKNLKTGKWMDDESLMVSIRVLLSEKPNCYSFGTHFFTKACMPEDESDNMNCTVIDLQRFDYDRVKNQGGRAPGGDIFKLDHLFFPINIANRHWTLIYVDMRKMIMFYYDSYWDPSRNNGAEYLLKCGKYLKEEHRNLHGTEIPDVIFLSPNNTMGPSQTDGYNCGVYITFVINAIACLSVNPEILFLHDDWNFDKRDMAIYRRRMAASILTLTIPEIPNLPEWKEAPVTSSPYRDHGSSDEDYLKSGNESGNEDSKSGDDEDDGDYKSD